MQWSIEKRTTIGFSLVLILVLIIGGGAYQITQQFIETNQLVAHTFEVIGELTQTLSLLSDAETGQRGYIITGDDAYLTPYTTAVSTLDAHLENLDSLTADNPTQQASLTSLLPLLTERLAVFAEIIDLRRTDGFEAAQQAVVEGRGKELMDEIRAVIGRMSAEENRLLEQRTLNSALITQNTRIVSLLLTILISGLLVFVFYQINRAIGIRQRSEARFKGLLEAAPDAMVIVNRDSRIVLANAQTQKIFGYSLDEMLGKHVDMLVPDRFKDHPAYGGDYFRDPAMRASTENMELVALRKDGSEFPVEIRLSPLETEEGTLLSSVIRDISERKKKDAEIVYQASLLANVTDAVLGVDTAQNATYWNKAAERIYGWTSEEMMGKNVRETLHSELSDEQRAMILKQIEEKGQYQLEVIHHRKDGAIVNIEATSMPLRNEFGQLTGYVSVNRDVTERKRFEQQNREREHLLRVMVDNLPERIFIKDTESRFLLANDSVVKLFGAESEADLLGKTDFDFHPREDAEIYRADEAEIMRTGKAKVNYEETVVDKNFKTKRYLNTTKLPLRDENGKLLGIIGINYDITERKEFEQALKLSEERWHSVVDSVPDIITVYDRSGIITFTNRITPPLSTDDIIGKSMFEFAPPDYRAVIERAVEIVIETSEPTTYELTTEQTKRNFIVRLGPITLDGRLVGFISSSSDITPLKEREAEIAYQANLLANVNDAIIATDSEFKITYWNHAAEEIYQWTQEEVLGKLAPEVVRTHLNDEQRAAIAESIKEGRYTAEVIQHRKDGTPIDIEGTTMPLPGADGAIIGYITVNRDIRERKRAREEINALYSELELRVVERTAQLAFLAEASSFLSESFDYKARLKEMAQLAVPQIADWCSISLLDEDGNLQSLTVVSADPEKLKIAAEIMRRYPQDPNTPSGAYQVVRTGESEFLPTLSQARTMVSQLGEEGLSIADQLGFRSSMTVPMLAHGKVLGTLSLIMAESGREYNESELVLAEDLARRAGLMIDNARLFEESQQLNAELEQRVAERTLQLEVTNKELEAFSYSVSHDLRAPLRSIDGFSQALLEDYNDQLDDEGKSYLRRVRAASQRMATLIDDLINLSRMTRAEMKNEVVPISNIVHTIASELQQDNPERQVEFVIQDGLVARGDKQLLRVALDNLIGNAWKFTSKRPHTRIEFGVSSQENGKTTYFVRDNGDGFDMAHVNKLFGAFQRLHAMTEFEGTGIGLATVKRIIHRHGGQVWAEGEVGQGAAFYFEL